MTRDEFKNIVKAVRGTFPNSPISTQQIFDLWYEMLQDMDYVTVAENLKNHIRENKFAPTVAELRGVVDAKDFNNFKRRKYNMNAIEKQLLEAEQRKLTMIDRQAYPMIGDIQCRRIKSTVLVDVQENSQVDINKVT